jgi:hypothetical protein
VPPRPRRASPAELGLLELAQSLSASVAGECLALSEALVLLEAAFGPGAPLPGQLAHAWLRTRGDKTGALALGWAREQVRQALAEVVTRARAPGQPEAEAMTPDSAAWLLLATAESESHEVGSTVGDRLRTVCALLHLT